MNLVLPQKLYRTEGFDTCCQPLDTQKSVTFPVFSSTAILFIYLFTRRFYNYLFPKYKDDGQTARQTDIFKYIQIYRDYL